MKIFKEGIQGGVMESVSRVVHHRERDLREILHPKIIKELPPLEEVLGLFHFLLGDVLSSSGSDVILEYYFSSRRKFGYDTNYDTRRTWTIVAYPRGDEAKFIPAQRFADHATTRNPYEWWSIGEIIRDPLFFCRSAPKNGSAENAVFFFGRDPLNKEYLESIKNRLRLLRLPAVD